MPWPVNIFESMPRACAEQQSLEEDADDYNDNEEFSYTCPLAHASPPCMRDAEFSFKPGHHCTVKDNGEKNRIYAKRLARHALELKENAQEFEEPFYKDMEMSGSPFEEEDSSRTRTYHLPVHQRKHTSRVANVSPCGSYDSYQHGTGKQTGRDVFSLWGQHSDPHLSSLEHTSGAEPHRWHKESIGDWEVSSLRVSHRALWEENNKLHRMVQSMQGSLESQAHSMRSLEHRLKASLAKEKRRARGLQALNQQMERSLQLMTQRALEAENHVEKLKQKMLLLQGELKSSKVKNESLRVGQSTDPEVMKHNVDFALKNLQKIIEGANWSIEQLVAGTESLNFVTEILKSSGKISDAKEEEDQ